MTPGAHRFYIASMVVLGTFVTIAIGWYGFDYYSTPVTARNLHTQHQDFSPSGFVGHGLGFLGTLLMIVGVAMYSLRKRWSLLHSVGRIKHILEFHIFLCLFGPVLIVYHTAFKFGGLVGVSFWCMVLVVASGIVGRYLYHQIPKSVLGNDLTLPELKRRYEDFTTKLATEFGVPDEIIASVDRVAESHRLEQPLSFHTIPVTILRDIRHRSSLKHVLANLDIPHGSQGDIARQIFRERAVLSGQMRSLDRSQQLFRLWHMVHLPFTIMMFLILIGHVFVSFLFGFTWIF